MRRKVLDALRPLYLLLETPGTIVCSELPYQVYPGID